MKQKLIVLLCSLLFTVGIRAQNEAIYIYRNDGQFNAFLKSDVDSIKYSHYDVDNKRYSDWKTQVIYTSDSIYKIPIAAIDSISLVTPEVKYKDNVIKITESWIDYIVSSTDSSIVFSTNIPTDLIPSVGQVLVAEYYEDPLPFGFSGRVTALQHDGDNFVCFCEPVGLEDIYDRLLAVGKAETINVEESENGAKVRNGVIINNNQSVYLPQKIALEVSLKDLLGIESNQDIGFGINFNNPSLTIDYIICIGIPNLKNYAYVNTHLASKGELELDASINANIDKEIFKKTFDINVYGIRGSIEFGLFINISGNIDVKLSFPFNFNISNGFEYSETEGFRTLPNDKNHGGWDEWDASLSLNGSLYMGSAIRTSIALLHNEVASVDLTTYIGPELSSSFVLDSQNDSIYTLLRNTELNASFKVKFEPGYRIWFNERKNFGMSLYNTMYEWNGPIVPGFENLKLSRDISKGDEFTYDIIDDLFFPVKVGWGLFDENDVCVDSIFYPQKYRLKKDWLFNSYIPSVPCKKKYKAYPLVKLFNIFNMKSDKFIELNECPAKIKKIELTKVYHEEGGYFMYGHNFKYKFIHEVTVELTNSEEIEDWGYVYLDISRKENFVSLKGKETTCKDTSCVFLTDFPKSYFSASGYVKYKGDSTYYYDDLEKFDFVYVSCPDDNHPHAIDLGLPSGVKWACCNVGANQPSGEGGYFAWGETGEKAEYYNHTHSFWDRENYKWKVIPTEISGTEYDAAHVNWGGNWQMPMAYYVQELIDNCTFERLRIDDSGMIGLLVTGPNGETIYLPHCGYKHSGHLQSWKYGECYYWSSSLQPDKYIPRGYILFYDLYKDWKLTTDQGEIYNGMPVRPITK